MEMLLHAEALQVEAPWLLMLARSVQSGARSVRTAFVIRSVRNTNCVTMIDTVQDVPCTAKCGCNKSNCTNMLTKPATTWSKAKPLTQPTLDPFNASDCGAQQVDMPKEVYVGDKKEMNAFLLFFEPLVERIVADSNCYAVKKNKTARFTRALLLTFIAVLLVMGLNPHPTNDLYWNNPVETPCGDVALFGVEFIQEVMTRAQFRELRRILHWTTDNYEQGVSGVEQAL